MPDDFLELGDGEKKDELILGKFKTPEDLAKAYSELEGMAKDLVRSFEKIDVSSYVPDLPQIVSEAYGQGDE